nr:MAG TPA: hypothetical protein [Caudoviricetes sp.]
MKNWRKFMNPQLIKDPPQLPPWAPLTSPLLSEG